MADYTVGIDAKFPLPAFEEMIKAQTDDERTRLRRKFYTDCVKHIDKIAADYIQPEEKTLDFALMYIPAENVYYETIIRYDDDKTDLRAYALQNKVIPVSPNLLYAYLMTVAMGLHGLGSNSRPNRFVRTCRISAGDYRLLRRVEYARRHLQKKRENTMRPRRGSSSFNSNSSRSAHRNCREQISNKQRKEWFTACVTCV
jgi:DNA recombination protein RmuC